jgi:hypothetical protein
MNDNLTSIAINVISSGIVLIIALTWNKWLLPWFKSLVYKGIIIDGTWKIEQATQMVDGSNLAVQRAIDINLQQNANELTGDASARIIETQTITPSTQNVETKQSKNLNTVIYYDVKGEIKDRFVSLVLRPKEQNKIAYSVLLLEVVGDGNTLKGYRTFYGYKKLKICAISCDLIRIK